jgi:hypothetical protein
LKSLVGARKIASDEGIFHVFHDKNYKVQPITRGMDSDISIASEEVDVIAIMAGRDP